MRLTLRTILAYIDDVLEPAQAREMGEKIAEGKEASALVSRIKDVLRRRRIGAPELAGPGSGPDPNVVSDYLENLLPPDQVVELERLCQASDVHLAEVAGCHKILTMVLGQPIDVSDEIRERMYALGTAKSSEPVASSQAPAMTEGIGKVEARPFESGLPEYLTRRSFSQRYGTALVILAIAGGWMALVATDPTLWTRPETKVASSAGSIEEADPSSVPATPPAGTAKGEHAHVANGAGRTPPQGTNPAVTVVPVMPMENRTDAPPMPMPPVIADNTTNGEMPLPSRPSPMPERVVVPVAPVLQERFPELRMGYLAGDEFVLQPHAVDPGWYVSSREVPVEVGDLLVSPSPFRNSYRIGDGLILGMQPATRIQRLMSPAEGDFGFELDQGQVTLQRSQDSPKTLTVRIRVLGQDYLVKLLEPGTRVGVELAPVVPNGPHAGQAEVVVQGGIVVAEGLVSVGEGGASVIELGPQSGYASWPATGTGTWTRSDITVPAWATAEGAFVTPATRQFGRLFAKEFNPMTPVEETLLTLVKDRRAGISELSVKALALTGNWKELVPELKNDHQESRLAAIAGLRHAMALNPNLEPQIRELLEASFPTDKVDAIIRLLWGFHSEDAKSPEESARLIGWMKDDDIAIRELAFQYVSKLTSRTFDYLPMAPSAERKAALGRWEDYLKRNNGALLTE